MDKTIFVVDDAGINLSMAVNALEDKYNVVTMSSGARMFAYLKKSKPDLILLDIEMPEMNGFDVIKRLKSQKEYSEIPVIFLTSYSDESYETLGFELGAMDFISKPFSVPVLQNRIKLCLNLDDVIRDRTTQLNTLKDDLIYTLADFAEARDKGTGGHLDRTSAYLRVLIDAMMINGAYVEEISDWNIDTVLICALLHDVGKIAIPDTILNKTGKLTDDEFEIMKTHTIEGERIIDKITARTNDKAFLFYAKLFSGCHHERWDGTGYPRGLRGEFIPLQGRIMAIVDVYDALRSKRPYKNEFSPKKSTDIILESAGSHFDPIIVDVFFKTKDSFEAISNIV